MTTLYLLVLMAPNSSERASALAKRFREGVHALGIPTNHITIALDGDPLPESSLRTGVYFGGPNQSQSSTARATQFVAAGEPILSIVPSTVGYHTLVPTALHGINGFADDGTDATLDRAVNLALEALGLLRRSRRIFISYHRKTAHGVAKQLAAALHDRGFLPFLDTQSVDEGTVFQRELWDSLADTDLVIFLDTAPALKSRWVAKEFARANALGCTLLHIIWPDRTRIRETELSVLLRLAHEDFLLAGGPTKGRGRLRHAALKRVLNTIEHSRVEAYAIRRARLIGGFIHRLRRLRTKLSIHPDGHMSIRGNHENLTIVPIVGAPHSTHFEDASIAHDASSNDVWMLYRAHGLHPRRCTHLNWLNLHLPTKLLELEATASWAATL